MKKRYLRLIPAALLAVPSATIARVDLANDVGPTGIYAFPDGTRLWTGPMVDENGKTLQYVMADGRVGRALKQAPGSFSDGGACPVTIKPDSAGQKLTVTDCRTSRSAKAVASPTERSLQFTASDGKRIAGAFWSLPGDRPAVVLCHGADYETRQMGAIIAVLLDAGLNVLALDQRGSGQSEGDWQPDGIRQVAADAAQAADLLRSRGLAIRVGFYGFSNGGWVAPAAAARFGRPTFVIIKSGDGQTVVDNIIYETRTTVGAKFGASSAAEAAATMRAVLVAVEQDTPDAWATATRVLKSNDGAPWRHLTALPPSSAIPLPPAVVAGYRRRVIYDPKQDLSKVRGPFLIMLGSADLDVEARASAARYRAIFRRAGKHDVTMRIFPGAGHQLVMGPGPAANSSMSPGRYAPGYLTLLKQWIAANEIQKSFQRPHRH